MITTIGLQLFLLLLIVFFVAILIFIFFDAIKSLLEYLSELRRYGRRKRKAD